MSTPIVCPACGMSTLVEGQCWNPICSTYSRPDPKPVFVSVQAMASEPSAPTAPLNEFLLAYGDDDNWWWRIGCGHHMNLFDAALERIDAVIALHSVDFLGTLCTGCGLPYPCPTVTTLAGGEV